MKTSTEMESLAKLVGKEKAIEIFAKVGFDAFDFSMFDFVRYDWATGNTTKLYTDTKDYYKLARHLKQVGEDNGIRCNQSHAPFPSMIPAIREMLELSIECTAEAGGEICIIHPDNNKTPEQNAEMYFELLPTAKACGVKIATENMWNWDEGSPTATPAACSHPQNFLEHITAVNDEYLVACVDIGHAEMFPDTSAVEMIKTLGSHVQALHIHDNDKLGDYHLCPFTSKIDFAPIVIALKEVNYQGYFTLEANSHLAKMDISTAEQGARELYQAVKRLADMFENN